MGEKKKHNQGENVQFQILQISIMYWINYFGIGVSGRTDPATTAAPGDEPWPVQFQPSHTSYPLFVNYNTR